MKFSSGPRLLRRLLIAGGYYLYNNCVGHLPLYFIRHAYLRNILRIQIGRGAAVHMGCFFTGRRITIGNRAIINRCCYLDGRGGIFIGTDVSISPECYLVSLTHDSQDPFFAATAKPIRVENRVWIGVRALILPGVIVGEGAVIGAGSIVTRNVEPFTITAGNPARKIGERSKNLLYSLDYRPFFDTDIT